MFAYCPQRLHAYLVGAHLSTPLTVYSQHTKPRQDWSCSGLPSEAGGVDPIVFLQEDTLHSVDRQPGAARVEQGLCLVERVEDDVVVVAVIRVQGYTLHRVCVSFQYSDGMRIEQELWGRTYDTHTADLQ